jgi:hypothetical protein
VQAFGSIIDPTEGVRAMSANRATYAPGHSGLSSETQSSIRQYLESKYQRTDFDLLEWAAADEVANYVFDGAVECKFARNSDPLSGVRPSRWTA